MIKNNKPESILRGKGVIGRFTYYFSLSWIMRCVCHWSIYILDGQKLGVVENVCHHFSYYLRIWLFTCLSACKELYSILRTGLQIEAAGTPAPRPPSFQSGGLYHVCPHPTPPIPVICNVSLQLNYIVLMPIILIRCFYWSVVVYFFHRKWRFIVSIFPQTHFLSLFRQSDNKLYVIDSIF